MREREREREREKLREKEKERETKGSEGEGAYHRNGSYRFFPRPNAFFIILIFLLRI